MGTIQESHRPGHVLFGQTRRDVLALLLGRPDERFYLREILRAVGSGSGAVQRELKQLVGAGLVHRVREGSHVYFSANRETPIFPELRSIIRKTAGAADVLRQALGPLIKQGRIAIAFVYGSVAEGTETAGSDLDLMVIGEATLAELVPAVRQAEGELGREVNPTVYPKAEFRKRVRSEAPFVTRVLEGPKLFIVGNEHELGRLAG